ncbi:right-handed parallel beta-helix repeat-containing protein [bacterium]|nr:right-handed parallel beta-helix repeat-containing protein [bacterium]
MGREFYGAWYGALVCEGTEGSHVILTGVSETPGSWRGVIFQTYTDDADSVMIYTDVTYAGQDTSANIRCESSEPTISHCTITNSSGYGIYADNGAAPYLSDNTINDNATYPISVYCNNVLGRLNGNTGSDNASGDVVVVRGGAVTTSQTYLNEPLPYRVTSAIEVYGVQNDATQPCILTIGPGTTVEFNSGCYIVLGRIFYGPWYGALVCAGTNNEHIVLTGATETPGSWNGIYFKDQTDDADSVLEYTEIRYAGTSYSANIRCQAASPTITNCVLTDSSAWAIYCDEDASPQLTGNIITDCNGGIRTSGASPTITNNTIVYNTGTQPAISASSSTTDISNNIVAFNNYGIYVSGGTVTLHCNDVYSNTNYQYSGISAAGDDISVDPQFANVSIDNYRLLEGSGCIDKGYDNAVDSTWYDLEFEPRVNGSHVDIGADEYYGSDASAPDTVITSGPAAGSTVDSLPVNFICSGIDNATAAGDLQYSWRIDGGEWSEFSTQTTHSYDDLSEGDHTVEVKAKDEAGNIDPTPATRHFHTSVQRVLFINVSGSYNSDGESIFTTLQNAGANAFYVLLDTEGKAASQISSIDFDQIWVYDLSTGNDAYTSDWQAIADWYTDHTECAIICDARMLSSYWNGQWQDEGQKLTENYYENIKDNGGGLVLGTGHSEYQTGINSINDLIGLEQFMGDFDLSMIPIDTISPLMTTPNDMGTELYDDSSSGQAPFGLQTNGRILYTVAWHSGSTDNPGISSTIRGGVGFHSTITSPLSGSSYIYGADIAFAATTTGGTAPYTYKWSSDIDGVLSTQQSFTTYTLSVGKHVIALTSTDSAGRIDEVSVIVYVTEDASAPDTSITSGPSNNSYTCTDAVTFTFTGSDDATPTSRLVYRWSLDDGAWSTDSAQTTVDLSGLATGSHTFEVAAVDIVGNIDASPASRSFNIFLSALEITDIVVSASQGDATVTWTTPIPADSTVEYGLTDSYELTPVSSSSMVTSHSISLTDLDPSTTYHYRVRSTDSCGREQISDDGTFTTPALPDLDAEFVSATDIAYAGLTASIKWRVTNVGSAVSMKSWTDCVYLSTDDQLSSDDISLVYMMRPLNLQPDANYTQTATVTLPMVTAGNYWLLLKADSEDTQPETDEDNNIAAYGPIDMRIMYIPVIAAIADESAVEGQAYTGPTPVLASGTLPVTWSLISGPSGMTIDHSTGVVIWSDPKGLPSGYTVTIQATNDAGAGTQSWQLTVPISYTASVNADIDSAVAGTPVHLSGSATWTENGTPAAGVSVAVRVLVKNTRRVYSVKTDTNGNFSYTFNPLANEAGRYSVAADHPNVTTDTVQDTFVLYGMAVNPSSVSEEVIPGTPLSDEVDLKNLGDVELTGVTATVLNAPSNLTVDVDCPSQLDASEIAALGYTLTASGDQDMSGTITIELESDQEAATSLTMPIHIKPDRPVLTAGTSPLQASMLRGTQTLVSVDITNSGGVSTTSLNVAIPSCSWMALATPTTIDPIAPGEKASIVLSLTPSETQELVEYDGTIVISSTTASLTLPFEFDCVSDKLGDLVLTAVDEFTYYAEGSPNVADAYVTLTRVDDASIVITGTTDSNGVAEFNNLPEAYYNIKLQALEHGPFTGSVLVEADQTREVTAFMPRELVTYVWKVVPTLIEDKYEITVEAIFETNVPAPVVTIEPANIDLSEMVDGRMQVDLTITNHGLIAAEEFELEFGDNPKYQFTPLTDKIGTLAAQTTVVVPLTIVDIEMHPEEHISQVSNVSKRDAKMSIMGDTSSSDPCIKLKAGALYVLKCGDDGKWKWIPINVVYPENVCPGSSTRPPSVSWWGGGGGRPSGGGWTGGGGGTSSTPYVSSSYVLTEPLCDPCMDKLGSCVMSFLPLGCGVGAVSSAGTAIYGCIGSDWISCIESILNGVAGTVVGCLDDVPIIGTAWNIYNCIKDMYSACWSGSSTKTTSAIERYNALTGRKMRLQDVGGDLNAAADYLELQADRIKPILDLYVEIFGDPIWLSAESVDTSLGTWFTAFYAATGEETPDGKSISADERTSLLNMTRPSQLTDSDVEKFLDRWNRTMEYYAAGIGTIDQVPDGQSTDFIPADEFKSKLLDAKTSLDEMEAEGFTEIFGGLSYASDQYIEATTNQDSGICARVKIQIEQEAVIARNAFKATLELENAGSSSLENVQVIVSIKDEESVTSNSLFGITDSALDGISDVDGDGVLSAGSTCKAEWTLVPTNDAAPTENKIYYVGATLNYTLNGSQVSVPIFPDAITVKPNPSLHLNYFMQKYVYSDDPFTDEVEPAEPFSLGLLVTNSGYGTAYDFQITSAQPQIIENEKGLLIDFKIIGTQIGTQEVSPSLTADFGDLAPQDTAVARWLMTSTLQGKFIDYSATYEHITDLGDLHLTSVDGDQTDDLSLINGVDIHELIHVVRIDVPGDDNKPDFLVNDEPDINSLPDIVYSSDATTAPVTSVTGATISGTLSPTNLQVHLSASAESGWCYIRGTDPGVERYRLTRVIRSDGREIMVDENAWTTHRTIRKEGQDPYRQHLVHIFDFDSTGEYTLIYEKVTSSTTTALAKQEADGASVSLGEDESLIVTAVFDGYFYVEPTDRVCGIRVTWSGEVSVGDSLTLSGTMGTTSSFERCLIADKVTVTGSGYTIEPFVMTNDSLGGCDLDYDATDGSGQRGIEYCSGANNIGLLVKTTGKVTAAGRTYFYIDDGTHANDGSIFQGVRVISGTLTKPTRGDYVTVTGISSILRVGDHIFRSITPRSASDIEIAGP